MTKEIRNIRLGRRFFHKMVFEQNVLSQHKFLTSFLTINSYKCLQHKNTAQLQVRTTTHSSSQCSFSLHPSDSLCFQTVDAVSRNDGCQKGGAEQLHCAGALLKWISLSMAQFSLDWWMLNRTMLTLSSGSSLASATPFVSKLATTKKLSESFSNLSNSGDLLLPSKRTSTFVPKNLKKIL